MEHEKKRTRGPVTPAVEVSEVPTPEPEQAPEPVVTEETPAMKELRERAEARAAVEPERPPHPYKWRLESPALVPFAFLDKKDGTPSKELIEQHIDDCWRAGTEPSIAGVLVGVPKQT